MTPSELVLSKLSTAKPNGNGWKARCPAHEDRNPSLSITTGDDGRALIHCHANCSPDSIIEALGLKMADLMPPIRHSPGLNSPRSATFGSAAEALASLERQHGPATHMWTYQDASGETVGGVARWDGPDGKTFRPISRVAGEWRVGGMPSGRPLYRLPELLRNTGKTVYVAEGEKAADAARSIGLVATTSAHGSKSFAQTDWKPLAGRKVVLLPDNDNPGREYAIGVAKILVRLNPPATVRIVELPDLPERGDFIEFLAARPSDEGAKIALDVGAIASSIKPFQCDAANSECKAPVSRKAALQIPVVKCMADIVPRPLEWLWRNRIPLGKVCMLAGDPAQGKSLLTTYIASRISTGRPWPDAVDEPIEAGSTLILSAEDDPEDTIVPRLMAANADLRRVHTLTTMRTEDGSFAPFNLECIPVLEAAMEKLPDLRLVIIDPVSAFLGKVDSHKAADVRGVLAPLSDLAQRRRVAILIVTHLTKGGGGKAMYRATGSLSFVAAARAAHLVAADPDQPQRRLVLPMKSNLGIQNSGLAYSIYGMDVKDLGNHPCVAWETAPVEMTADQLLSRETEPSSHGRELESAVNWLRELLAPGPVLQADVKTAATQAGFSWATVRRAKTELRVKPIKNGFGSGASWSWSLIAPGEYAHKGAQSETVSTLDENEHLRDFDSASGGGGETVLPESDALLEIPLDPAGWRK